MDIDHRIVRFKLGIHYRKGKDHDEKKTICQSRVAAGDVRVAPSSISR